MTIKAIVLYVYHRYRYVKKKVKTRFCNHPFFTYLHIVAIEVCHGTFISPTINKYKRRNLKYKLYTLITTCECFMGYITMWELFKTYPILRFKITSYGITVCPIIYSYEPQLEREAFSLVSSGSSLSEVPPKRLFLYLKKNSS